MDNDTPFDTYQPIIWNKNQSMKAAKKRKRIFAPFGHRKSGFTCHWSYKTMTKSEMPDITCLEILLLPFLLACYDKINEKTCFFCQINNLVQGSSSTMTLPHYLVRWMCCVLILMFRTLLCPWHGDLTILISLISLSCSFWLP